MPGLFQRSSRVVNPACSNDGNFRWRVHCVHGLGTASFVINVPNVLGLGRRPCDTGENRQTLEKRNHEPNTMEGLSSCEGMTVLITGGAGFIGSNLAEALLERGAKVVVLDNLLTGHLRNLESFFDHPNFTFIEGDIRDVDTCLEAAKGCTHISHQAALGSVPRSIDDPLLSLNINIMGTANVFHAGIQSGVKRIVYASSSSVYGDDETLPKVESITGQLLSPYASSKRSMEMIQQAFVSCYDVEILGFRYFNVFGKRQDPDGPYAAVIPKFVAMLMKGESPVIFGDGEQSRDFTHISNVVSGNLLALTKPSLEPLNGHVLNLAYGGTTTVNDLFFGIRESLAQHLPESADVEPHYTDPRKGDILHSHANIQGAVNALGFTPSTDLQSGLDQTVAWYVNNP